MGGSSTSKSWSWEKTTSGPEQWVQDEGSNLYAGAKRYANKNWQGYGGERVAGYDPTQWGSVQDMVANINGPDADLGTTRGLLDQLRGVTDVNKTTADYMNPFVEATLDPMKRNVNEQANVDRMRLGEQAAMAGAFGDARQGIESSMIGRNATQAISDATGQAYAGAYDRAANERQGVLNRALQLGDAYAGLSNVQNQRDQTKVKMTADLAERDRALRQANDDVKYSNFVEKRDWKKNNYAWLLDYLNTTPHDTISETQGWQVKKEPNGGAGGILGKLAGTLLGSIFGPMGSSIGGSLGGNIGKALGGS